MTVNPFEPTMIGAVVSVKEIAHDGKQKGQVVRESVGTLQLYIVSGASVFYKFEGEDMASLGSIGTNQTLPQVMEAAENKIAWTITEGFQLLVSRIPS